MFRKKLLFWAIWQFFGGSQTLTLCAKWIIQVSSQTQKIVQNLHIFLVHYSKKKTVLIQVKFRRQVHFRPPIQRR